MTWFSSKFSKIKLLKPLHFSKKAKNRKKKRSSVLRAAHWDSFSARQARETREPHSTSTCAFERSHVNLNYASKCVRLSKRRRVYRSRSGKQSTRHSPRVGAYASARPILRAQRQVNKNDAPLTPCEAFPDAQDVLCYTVNNFNNTLNYCNIIDSDVNYRKILSEKFSHSARVASTSLATGLDEHAQNNLEETTIEKGWRPFRQLARFLKMTVCSGGRQRSQYINHAQFKRHQSALKSNGLAARQFNDMFTVSAAINFAYPTTAVNTIGIDADKVIGSFNFVPPSSPDFCRVLLPSSTIVHTQPLHDTVVSTFGYGERLGPTVLVESCGNVPTIISPITSVAERVESSERLITTNASNTVSKTVNSCDLKMKISEENRCKSIVDIYHIVPVEPTQHSMRPNTVAQMNVSATDTINLDTKMPQINTSCSSSITVKAPTENNHTDTIIHNTVEDIAITEPQRSDGIQIGGEFTILDEQRKDATDDSFDESELDDFSESHLTKNASGCCLSIRFSRAPPADTYGYSRSNCSTLTAEQSSALRRELYKNSASASNLQRLFTASLVSTSGTPTALVLNESSSATFVAPPQKMSAVECFKIANQYCRGRWQCVDYYDAPSRSVNTQLSPIKSASVSAPSGGDGKRAPPIGDAPKAGSLPPPRKSIIFRVDSTRSEFFTPHSNVEEKRRKSPLTPPRNLPLAVVTPPTVTLQLLPVKQCASANVNLNKQQAQNQPQSPSPFAAAQAQIRSQNSLSVLSPTSGPVTFGISPASSLDHNDHYHSMRNGNNASQSPLSRTPSSPSSPSSLRAEEEPPTRFSFDVERAAHNEELQEIRNQLAYLIQQKQQERVQQQQHQYRQHSSNNSNGYGYAQSSLRDLLSNFPTTSGPAAIVAMHENMRKNGSHTNMLAYSTGQLQQGQQQTQQQQQKQQNVMPTPHSPLLHQYSFECTNINKPISYRDLEQSFYSNSNLCQAPKSHSNVPSPSFTSANSINESTGNLPTLTVTQHPPPLRSRGYSDSRALVSSVNINNYGGMICAGATGGAFYRRCSSAASECDSECGSDIFDSAAAPPPPCSYQSRAYHAGHHINERQTPSIKFSSKMRPQKSQMMMIAQNNHKFVPSTTGAPAPGAMPDPGMVERRAVLRSQLLTRRRHSLAQDASAVGGALPSLTINGARLYIGASAGGGGAQRRASGTPPAAPASALSTVRATDHHYFQQYQYQPHQLVQYYSSTSVGVGYNQSRRFSSSASLAAAATAAAAASGVPIASHIAIDSKIEQAMDLVKSHLMFAVREEVELLRTKIVELESAVIHLEAENSILREHVPTNVLQSLQAIGAPGNAGAAIGGANGAGGHIVDDSPMITVARHKYLMDSVPWYKYSADTVAPLHDPNPDWRKNYSTIDLRYSDYVNENLNRSLSDLPAETIRRETVKPRTYCVVSQQNVDLDVAEESIVLGEEDLSSVEDLSSDGPVDDGVLKGSLDELKKSFDSKINDSINRKIPPTDRSARLDYAIREEEYGRKKRANFAYTSSSASDATTVNCKRVRDAATSPRDTPKMHELETLKRNAKVSSMRSNFENIFGPKSKSAPLKPESSYSLKHELKSEKGLPSRSFSGTSPTETAFVLEYKPRTNVNKNSSTTSSSDSENRQQTLVDNIIIASTKPIQSTAGKNMDEDREKTDQFYSRAMLRSIGNHQPNGNVSGGGGGGHLHRTLTSSSTSSTIRPEDSISMKGAKFTNLPLIAGSGGAAAAHPTPAQILIAPTDGAENGAVPSLKINLTAPPAKPPHAAPPAPAKPPHAAPPAPSNASTISSSLAKANGVAPKSSHNNNNAKEINEDGIPLVKLHGLVGFDSLPYQLVRRCQNNGFQFNLLCVGETGMGKTTLVESLFNRKMSFDPCSSELKTVELRTQSCEVEESNVRVRLRVVETAGFGDQLDKEKSAQVIVNYINEQFEAYLREELKIRRFLSTYDDTRIHACLYFISPTGHGLKALDVVTMRELSKRANVIPVIAKSDTASKEELVRFKLKIMSELKANNIDIYQFPTDDEAVRDENAALNALLPFAVVGSTDFVTKEDGRLVRARNYVWGRVEVENEEHCDFVKLREALLRINEDSLRERTHTVLYEAYRRQRLLEMRMGDGDAGPRMIEATLKRRKELDAELRRRDEQFKAEFEARVQRKEIDLKHREEGLNHRQRQMDEKFRLAIKELDHQIAHLEEEKSRLINSNGAGGCGGKKQRK